MEGGRARVFLGELLGQSSPVSTFTPLVAAELRVNPGETMTLEVNPDHEHGLLVDAGDIQLEGVTVAPRELAYTGTGETTLRIRNTGDTQALLILIGGEPFTEDIVMWWNFIGRDHAEIEKFREQWEAHDERFGVTRGYISHDPDGLHRLPAPKLPNSVIKPRVNPEPTARPDLRID